VFLVGGRFAGFALVDNQVCVPENAFRMGPFFVMKRCRRRGFGSRAAASSFEAFRGRWEGGQAPKNLAALAFWRTLIGASCAGAYTEYVLDPAYLAAAVACMYMAISVLRPSSLSTIVWSNAIGSVDVAPP
jgi:hypothetical protein